MAAGPKVLIVDDEERFRTTMHKLLSVRGVDASVAANGKEALNKLREHSYDVVILDVRMPEISGIDLLPEIKKIDSFIEVIIMTGYASVATAREIMKLGAYDFLLKPYTIVELLEKIEGAFDRKTARMRLKADRPQTESSSNK
jgi:DNA-binding NtrC family response regulator